MQQHKTNETTILNVFFITLPLSFDRCRVNDIFILAFFLLNVNIFIIQKRKISKIYLKSRCFVVY